MTFNYVNADLKILFWNTRSLCTRKEELEKIIKNYNIIVCVESWLTVNSPYSNFTFPGFLTLRKIEFQPDEEVLHLLYKKIFHLLKCLI